MIERIIEWSSQNRFIVLLAYLLFSIAGILAVANLPVDAIPDLSENQVIVFSEWMGRSPEIVEKQLTFPLVSALQGMPQVKAVRASSMFGMSFVFVIFDDNTDQYFARTRVLERLNTIKSQLPAGVVPTLGPDGTGVGHIYWYTIEGDGYDPAALRAIQDWYVRYKLSAVEGVAEIAGIGGTIRQYQVDLSPDKMRAFNVTLADMTSAIQRANNEVGGKIIEASSAEYYIRSQSYLAGTDEIENICVKSTPEGTPVLLKQVATVQLGGDIRRGALDKDGNGEVVGGIVVMRNGENALRVIDRVKERIARISPGLPPGVRIVPSYDRSTLIREAIGTLDRALWEAAIVVSLMVAIFLLHLRSIIRIIIEIPVSILLAFILMYVFNITSNIMSLGGIILAVGVIVDSSIVMVENAYRNIAAALEEHGRLEPGDYKHISIMSAKQVGRAIFFSELIILISFIPVFLLTGQEGKLFRPLAFTKTFVMAGSAAVVITLIPVLMTFLMRGKFRNEQKNPVTHLFMALYEPIIAWVLKHRTTTILLNIAALLITVPMMMNTGSEFMPPLDEGSILYMPVTLPNASITEVTRILRVQDQIIRGIPEVSHVLGKAGRAETATDNAPLSMIETIILLKPKSEWRPGITKKDIINELDAKLQIPGVRNGWTQPIINRINMLATGVRTDLGLKLYGDNLDTLQKYAIQAEAILRSVRGASDVVAERGQNGYYLDIRLNRAAIARYGLNPGDVQDIIETLIGGEPVSVVLEGRMRFPLRMRFDRDLRDGIDELRRLVIPIAAPAPGTSGMAMSGSSRAASSGRTSMASMAMPAQSNEPSVPQTASLPGTLFPPREGTTLFLPLGELATLDIATGPPMMNSENGMLSTVVYMNARGRDMGGVMDDAQAAISASLHLPPGYTCGWSGQYEGKLRAQRTLMLIMPAVFLIIFVLLYLTLKDYKEAGIVMLSVPFALVGGVYIVYALGYNFSVAVWVGFIALYGIATETGVVMVVYLHEALDRRLKAHAEGLRGPVTLDDIREATIEGSVRRLRPKLMTVATSMIGLVPVLWSTGTGSDVMKPLTAPMVGGLFTSAVHVLIVTPVLFAMMKERALKQGTLEISRISSWMKEN